jgi:hypothetical protein
LANTPPADTSARKVRRTAIANPSIGRLSPPLDWQNFERLMRDLFVRISGDAHADLNGRTGQPQCGVDVSCVDQVSRQQIGIQCRGRGSEPFGGRRHLPEKEFRAEVQKAHKFIPHLDKFILLTTGPNDTRMKRLAAQLSEQNRAKGLFEVQFHGWDWIEGKLCEHLDLAIRYGLVAIVALGDSLPPTGSKIAREIGARFAAALQLMNDGREVEDRFTLQSLASLLGLPDWRRLEEIFEARSDATTAELQSIAAGLGISARWLIEGKGAPFAIDPETYCGATEQYEVIRNLAPRKIVFVRERDGHNDSFVVAQLNDVKWFTFRWYHPSGPHVGGTGRHQLMEYCCLMRRIYRTLDFNGQCACFGFQLESKDFWRALVGEVYPGSLFENFRNDDWWCDLAELAEHRVDGELPDRISLREAVRITREVFRWFQQDAMRSEWTRNLLVSAGLPFKEQALAESYDLDLGLTRAKLR